MFSAHRRAVRATAFLILAGLQANAPADPIEPLLKQREALVTDDRNQDTKLDAGDVVRDKLVLPTAPPADPATLAPSQPLDLPYDFCANNAFLLDGPTPSQYGFAREAFDCERLAVLRGTVLDENGAPLPMVAVSVLGAPQYGTTLTRADGRFDLAVNGGTTLTLNFAKPAHLVAQRSVDAVRNRFSTLTDEVVLLTLSSESVTIDMTQTGQPFQVAAGPLVTDDDGTRRSVLLFPEGVTATLNTINGPVSADTLTVRQTEYTVGERGPRAMPAALPPQTGYTYCVELSADEADPAEARSVEFNPPLINYVDNYLDVPIGVAIPLGFYNRERGMWESERDGIALKILSVTNGIAALDLDGDDVAEDSTALQSYGITESELLEIGRLYTAGKSIWRVEIPHFTPWDCNFPAGPPLDAVPPPINPPAVAESHQPPDPQEDCDTVGSRINYLGRSLQKFLTLPGTDMSLAWSSAPSSSRPIPITIPVADGSTLPANLIRIEAEVEILGKKAVYTLLPGAGLTVTHLWDGLDIYNRPFIGETTGKVTVRYHYPIVYYGTTSQGNSDFNRSFGRLGGGLTFQGGRTSANIGLERTFEFKLGPLPPHVWSTAEGRPNPALIGGWGLTEHHHLSPESKSVFLGSGEVLRYYETNYIANELWRESNRDSRGQEDGKRISETNVGSIYLASFAPNGDLYVVASYINIGGTVLDRVLMRITPDQRVYRVSGGIGSAALRGVTSMAIGNDGTVYLARYESHDVLRVLPNGAVERFAGTGVAPTPRSYTTPNVIPESVKANETVVGYPGALAVGPDDSVYIMTDVRIRRVDPSGYITTILGDGAYCFDSLGCADGIPAINSRLAGRGGGSILVDRTGNIYFHVDFFAPVNPYNLANIRNIRRISPTGIVDSVLGFNVGNYTGATPLGQMALDDMDQVVFITNGIFYRVDPSTREVTLLSGPTGSPRNTNPGLGPWSIRRYNLGASLLLSDRQGTLYSLYSTYTGGSEIPPRVFIRLGFGGEHGFRTADGGLGVPSRTGQEVYLFDRNHRHIETRSMPGEHLLRRFHYHPDGLLDRVEDNLGRTFTIRRNGQQEPLAIDRNDGGSYLLALDSRGWLNRLELPTGEVHQLTTDSRNLVVSHTAPRGLTTTYGFNEAHLLESVTASDGLTLEIQEKANDVGVLEVDVLRNGVRNLTIKREREYDLNGRTEKLILTQIDAFGNETTTVQDYAKGPTTTMADGTRIVQLMDLPQAGPTAVLAPLSTEIISPSGRKTTSLYTRLDTFAGSELSTREDKVTQDGIITTAIHNAAAATTTYTKPGLGTVVYTMDTEGRIESVTHDDLPPLTYLYDNNDLLVEMAQHGIREGFLYDEDKRLIGMTNEAGDALFLEYDTNNRLASLTLPGDRRFDYSFGTLGDIRSITLPGGAVYTFDLDARGREIAYHPAGSTEPFRRFYRPDGTLDRVEMPSGNIRTLNHDLSGRVTSINTEGTIIRFTYNGQSGGLCCGNGAAIATSEREAVGGNTQTLAYVHDGPFVMQQNFGGHAIANYEYVRNSAGVETSRRAVIGATTLTRSYTLNPTTRLPATEEGFQITRGTMGLATQVTNGTFTASDILDPTLRLTDRTFRIGDVPFYTYNVGIGPAQRVYALYEKTPTTEGTTAYGYTDTLLTSVTREGETPETYGWDPNTNPTTFAGQTQVFNSADQLVSSGASLYGYTADGVLNSRDADFFIHDGEGVLTSVVLQSGEQIDYTYDPLGRLVSRDSSTTGRIDFFYGDPSWQFRVTETRTEANVLRSYFYLEDGSLFAVREGTAFHYVGTGPNRAPRVVVDSTGTLVREIKLSVWGAVLADSNPSYYLPVAISGGIPDPTTGLVKIGLRWYDPATGRFTTPDPSVFSAGSYNLYGYANGNPATHFDPSGLFSFEFSAYRGIGLGFKVGLDENGVSLCGEAGVGLGGGLDLNFFGAADETGSERGLELSGKVGPAGLAATAKWKPCGDGWKYDAADAKVNVGPVGYSTSDGFYSPISTDPIDVNAFTTQDLKNLRNMSPTEAFNKLKNARDTGKLGGKLEGKAYQKECVGKKW